MQFVSKIFDNTGSEIGDFFPLGKTTFKFPVTGACNCCHCICNDAVKALAALLPLAHYYSSLLLSLT